MKPSIKLLLIDDSSEVRKFLAPMLRKQGYEVEEASAGMDGLRLAREKRPDLVLLDVVLPDINGLVICKQLKTDPALQGIFVVLITGEAVSWEDRAAGLAVGADECLAKPIEPRELLSWVQAMVRAQQAEKWLRASEQRFRALVEHSCDAIAVLDAEGNFAYASPSTAGILGYREEELIGHSAFELVHAEDRSFTLGLFQRLLQTPGTSQSAQFRYRHKDGLCRWLEGTGTNLLSDPAVRGIVVNYRDIDERMQAERALRSLSSRLIEAQEAERRHLAREIHDEIGQALMALELNLQSLGQVHGAAAHAPQVKESIALVERLIEQVHDIALGLRPPMLDDLGLAPALRWYTSHQAKRANLRAVFASDFAQTRLDPAIETACYRVGQEAVTNVVRHARARELEVQLTTEDDFIHLRVRDDGLGFDLSAIQQGSANHRKLGLLGMRERVALARGRIEFKSSPRKGTEVHAWFPLSGNEAESGDETAGLENSVGET